jgi:Family of unknown function (DUF5329)
VYRLLTLLVLLAAGTAHAFGPSIVEARKIEYLINSVATLQNAQFVRNGTSYDGKSAADHLRLKLKNAGSKITTVEDFIRLCGTGSSVSGIPYTIRFADGTTVNADLYFRQKLALFVSSGEPRSVR